MNCESVKAVVDSCGFAQIKAVFAEAELDKAERIIDHLMLNSSKAIGKLRRDMSPEAEPNRLLQPEFIRPSLLSRELRESSIFTRCRDIAGQLLGGKVHYLFDHAIYKMPRSQTETPWHQDQAYLGEGIPIRSVHFWIPFQDVSSRNGTMKYVEGSHRSLLPHSPAHRENPHVLTVNLAPVTDVHELRLSKGDVSIHTNLTLHATGPNQSDQIRKAWIIHFGERPAWYKHWLQVKRSIGLG